MRTLTTGENKVLSGKTRSNYLRVWVKNASGVWTDLTTLRGRNYVLGADWGESVENYVANATVHLKRDVSRLSLANLMAASVLNTGGPLLEIGRELKIETATMPRGVKPASADWHMAFHGYIDNVDWSKDPISIACRDQAGQLLQDAQIETERAYGAWEASRTLVVGYVQQPSGNPPNGQPTTLPQFWRVTTAGTTGATEPAWPASPSVGATIADGTVVYTYQAAVAWSATSARSSGAFTANPTNTLQYWQCIATGTTGGSNPFPSSPTQGQIVTDGTCQWQYYASLGGTPAETVIQQIINDTLGAGVVALTTPAASNWFLGPYTQQRTKLFQAISALSEQLGWDLRYRWSGSEAAGDFALTFQAVPRTAPSVAWTFAPGAYFDVTTLERQIDSIRNAVLVAFPDSESVDPTSGQAPRKTVLVTDGTSIGKYKRRYMEVAEGATSAINTTAVATVFANALLSDLKEPLLAAEVELPYFWPVQLNDYVTLKANGTHFDSDQSVAVVSAHHTFDATGADGHGRERTVLGVRGLPTAGAQKHLDKEAAATAPLYSRKAPAAAASLSVVAGIRGGRVKFSLPATQGSKFKVAELHISTVNGFTPDGTTLKDWGLKNRFDFADLTPGTTYYAKVMLRDQRGNVAAASNQVSFVADKVHDADVADVATSKLTGTIDQTQLETALRTGFKRKSVTPGVSPAFSNGGDLPALFDSVVQDSLGVSSAAGIFNPGTAGPVFGELRCHLYIRGANLTPGCSAIATLQVGATIIATSRRAFATDSANAYHQPEIPLDFVVKHAFAASTNHKLLITVVDGDGTAVTGCYLAAERGVTALAAVGRGASVHLGEQYLDPSGVNGHAYRVTTAGITNAGAVTYGTTDYLAQTDGTAVLTEDGANAPRVGTFFEFIPIPA